MYEQFKQILMEQMNIDEDQITEDAQLVADLGINSLELADLVYNYEEKFGIEIDEDAYQHFSTVGDVVKYLESVKPE